MSLLKGTSLEVIADSPVLRPDEIALLSEAVGLIEAARQDAALMHMQATQACDQLLAQAHRDCEAFQAHAAAEAQSLKQEAYEQGLAEGRQQAALELAHLARAAEQQAAAMESYIVRSVLIGVRTVLGQLPPDERMRRMVTRALAQVEIPGSLTMYVNPDDAAAAAQGIEALPEGGSMSVRVVADAALPVGACRLQSEFGTVEAGLQSQLEALTQAVADVAGARGLAHPDSVAGQ